MNFIKSMVMKYKGGKLQMELFDEDFMKNEKTDNKKITTIIMIIMIFLIVMVLLVIGTMVYIKQTTLNVTLNGQSSNTIKNMISIDENNPQKVYVPIRKIAKLLGYNDYNGSYTTKSEEKNQCYVECENEVAMFALNSNVIYKTLTDGNSDFEYFTIDEPVKSFDGELYTTIEGIEKAFNVYWNYDIENNTMKIYTMPYLINSFSSKIIDYGYDNISENFTNQKAVLDDKLIVEKGKDKNNKKVGVLDISEGQAKVLLEDKYENIEYLQHTKDFLITADGKKGIISSNKKTRVKPQYDEIQLMDYDSKLYIVKKSDKYGIIDFNGKKVLEEDYDEIGIEDISSFKENDIKSKYILADNLIPVKKGKAWGFFNTKGNQVTDFKYDSIGYLTSNNKAGTGYSLLTVPDYNVIVVHKGDRYNVITSSGKEVFDDFFFTSIYLSINGEKESYVLEIDSATYDLVAQLDGLGYGKNNSNRLIDNSNQEDEKEKNQENKEENVQGSQERNQVENQENSDNNNNKDNGNNNNNDNNNNNGNNDNGNNNNDNNNNT